MITTFSLLSGFEDFDTEHFFETGKNRSPEDETGHWAREEFEMMMKYFCSNIMVDESNMVGKRS